MALPCNSTREDLEDAKLVANSFNVPFLEIDITDVYNRLENEINKELDKSNISKTISKEANINVKPRLRMTTLYATAQTMDYLVMGTGNLSEIMMGYTTKWGDGASDLNPIANFTVEEVLSIGEYLGVPDKILRKSPNDGLGMETDEEKMGVKYSQVSEYINTGKTDKEAMEIIEKKSKTSKHKRDKIPVYYFERKNYLG